MLVTSALPYADGPIHFGHVVGAYLPADVYVRFRRQRGDEVLFVSPPWFFYELLVRSAGAVPVRVRSHPPGWNLDVEAVAAAITERTRAIIVNSPNNPTGRIYPQATLDRLADDLADASERNGRTVMREPLMAPTSPPMVCRQQQQQQQHAQAAVTEAVGLRRSGA